MRGRQIGPGRRELGLAQEQRIGLVRAQIAPLAPGLKRAPLFLGQALTRRRHLELRAGDRQVVIGRVDLQQSLTGGKHTAGDKPVAHGNNAAGDLAGQGDFTLRLHGALSGHRELSHPGPRADKLHQRWPRRGRRRRRRARLGRQQESGHTQARQAQQEGRTPVAQSAFSHRVGHYSSMVKASSTGSERIPRQNCRARQKSRKLVGLF